MEKSTQAATVSLLEKTCLNQTEFSQSFGLLIEQMLHKQHVCVRTGIIFWNPWS